MTQHTRGRFPRRYRPAALGGDPFFANVVFLWHADGANGAGPVYVPTVGTSLSAQGPSPGALTTANKQFGTASYLCAADAIRAAVSALYNIRLQNFVLEWWQYAAVTTSGVPIDMRPAGVNGVYPAWYFTGGSQISMYVNSTDALISGSVPLNTWQYNCYARTYDAGTPANSRTHHMQGLAAGNATSQGNFNDVYDYMAAGNTGIYLGESAFDTGAMSGALDEIRLTIGTNRNITGSSYPVPTAAFPDF